MISMSNQTGWLKNNAMIAIFIPNPASALEHFNFIEKYLHEMWNNLQISSILIFHLAGSRVICEILFELAWKT